MTYFKKKHKATLISHAQLSASETLPSINLAVCLRVSDKKSILSPPPNPQSTVISLWTVKKDQGPFKKRLSEKKKTSYYKKKIMNP